MPGSARRDSRPKERLTKMIYDFLIETYETERLKVLSVWSEFTDADLPVRPRPTTREAAASTSKWSINV
jgi:hypothetical protein